MFYINKNLQLDAIFTVNGTDGWYTVEINYLLNVKEGSDLAVFELYRPLSFSNATEACGVLYQHASTSKILYNTALLTLVNSTKPQLTFSASTSYEIPLVNQGSGDDAPLSGTSILALPYWVAYNSNTTSANPNGVHRVFYQTTGGKVVATTFEADKTTSGLRSLTRPLQGINFPNCSFPNS